MAWTPHKEGDAITLAAVNANISALETQANLVPADAITFKSLHSEHLPSVIGEARSKRVFGEEQTYINTYPGWERDVTSGPAHWQVIANSTHGDLGVSFTGVDMAKNKVLIMANIGVKNINHRIDGNGAVTKGHAAVKIQVKNAAGDWVGLARTERFLSPKRDDPAGLLLETRHGDIPIRTLVDSSDTAVVYGVRAVVSISYRVSATLDDDCQVSLLNSNLSAITIKQAI